MTAPTRRQLMAGSIAAAGFIPAAGMASLPALASQAPDPIFAAIEAHKAAGAAFEAAAARMIDLEEELPQEAAQSELMAWKTRIVETDDPRWIAAIKARAETAEAADDMAWALLEENPPITVADEVGNDQLAIGFKRRPGPGIASAVWGCLRQRDVSLPWHT